MQLVNCRTCKFTCQVKLDGITELVLTTSPHTDNELPPDFCTKRENTMMNSKLPSMVAKHPPYFQLIR